MNECQRCGGVPQTVFTRLTRDRRIMGQLRLCANCAYTKACEYSAENDWGFGVDFLDDLDDSPFRSLAKKAWVQRIGK